MRHSHRIPRPIFWLFAGIALAALFNPVNAQTIPPPDGIPSGFYLIDSARGVALYRKDYSNGNPDYVQIIDLSQGAFLKLLHGEISEPRPTKGVYGGADPSMTSLPIETYWQRVTKQEKDAFCVVNGLFFYMPEYPTRLAFPLKVNGELVTDGWGINTYVGQQLILELWEDRADIRELNSATLADSSAPNLIGGLTEEANKRAKFSVGRTFVGIDDRDGDGDAETILVFSTLSAKQSAAADTLRSFGADEVMMLDGGGSTQLLCQSGWHIRSDRPVPQAIALIAAPRPPVEAEVVALTEWPVIIEGENLPLEVELKNIGVSSWSPETTSFVIQTDRIEFEQRQAARETLPGETETISQTIVLFEESGVQPVEIQLGIEYDGLAYPINTLQFQVVVLPDQLRSRKAQLISQMQAWQREQPQDVGRLVEQWIETQMKLPAIPAGLEGIAAIRPMDAMMIPLLMLPGIALIAWLIARTQHKGSS